MSQSGEQRRYTLGEFFSLAGDERMELYEGTIVLMSPAPYEHEGVVANLIAEFRMALKGNSLSCVRQQPPSRLFV
ncbi:Uma2 family endonuclease [Geobacillus sp. JS12]|uniref:Uma2 family endonuclease n=1 Tax=Geobacillus sp. JS12 TaxID=1813182 RepID=UPI000B2BDC1B|nr:Uma2 family endonuclease [Geobacillus sp. JS12]